MKKSHTTQELKTMPKKSKEAYWVITQSDIEKLQTELLASIKDRNGYLPINPLKLRNATLSVIFTCKFSSTNGKIQLHFERSI